jgi:transcriptional regulator with XRE-family HTH domain
MTREEVVALLQRRVDRAGSQNAVAKEIGVTAAYIGDVLRGKRDPGPSILSVLGLRRQVQITYVKKDKK